MRMRAPTSPVPDPFLAPVRRRHPDVDLVVLPAEGPPAPAAVRPDEALGALRDVEQRLRLLWTSVAPEAEASPEARLRFGTDAGSVRPAARVVATDDHGAALLDRLRAELARVGWSVRADRAGDAGAGLVRLAAALDDLDLVASWAEASGALVVTLTTASLPVGREAAGRLTRSRSDAAGGAV